MQRYTARAHPRPEGCETIPVDDPHYGVAPKWKPVSRRRNPRNSCAAMARRSPPRRSLATRPKASRMQNQQDYEGRTRMERSHGKPIDRRESGIPLRDLRALCGSNLRSDFDSLAGKRNQPRRNQRARRNETSHHGMVPCPPNRQRLKTRIHFGPVPELHLPVPVQRQSGLWARNWVRSASKKPKPSEVIWADLLFPPSTIRPSQRSFQPAGSTPGNGGPRRSPRAGMSWR